MSVIQPSLRLQFFDNEKYSLAHLILSSRGLRFAGLLLWLLLLGTILSACTRSVSVSPLAQPTLTAPPSSSSLVKIDQVKVIDNKGIYISGHSNLPSGECIKTNLLADQKAVDWWPRDVCIQPDAGQWEMLVSLGRNGAPAQLDSKASYELQAWWPKQEKETQTRFPFDLQGPKQ